MANVRPETDDRRVWTLADSNAKSDDKQTEYLSEWVAVPDHKIFCQILVARTFPQSNILVRTLRQRGWDDIDQRMSRLRTRGYSYEVQELWLLMSWKFVELYTVPGCPGFKRKVEFQHTFLKNELCSAYDVERVFDVFLSRLNLIPNMRIAIGEGSVTGPSRSQIRSWLRKAASGNMGVMPLEHNRFMMLRNSGTSVEYTRVATVLVFLGLWKVTVFRRTL